MSVSDREVQTPPGAAQGRPWLRPRPRGHPEIREPDILERLKQHVEIARSPVRGCIEEARARALGTETVADWPVNAPSNP